MKLYIWEHFCPDYTSGLAVAVAGSEQEARSLVIDAHDGAVWEWGELSVFELDCPVAACVAGGG